MTASDDKIVVCLGYPAVTSPAHIERLRAIDPRIEPLVLPVDPDGDWMGVDNGDPHPEPPPWAQNCADERRAVLARSEVLIALLVSADLQQHAPKLRWVQSVGAGVEQFAKAGVRRGDVVVTNASGLSAPSMAEFVVGRLLQVWKHFRELDEHQQDHEYVRSYGRSFAGSTIGIVGMGAIGRAVGERARALGCRVLGMRRSHAAGAPPSADDAVVAHEMFAMTQLHEMVARCNAVVVAAPATGDTQHLIDAEALAAMPRGVVVVNVARGSLLDEAAIVDALKSGHVGAAALDVFETEPLPPESPLWDAPNLYLSAHSSVSVDRYMTDVFDRFVANLERYVAKEPLTNVVDMDALGFD